MSALALTYNAGAEQRLVRAAQEGRQWLVVDEFVTGAPWRAISAKRARLSRSRVTTRSRRWPAGQLAADDDGDA